MSQAVTDESKPTLYEVDANAGRCHTDKQRSEQRTLHEVVREESPSSEPPEQSSGQRSSFTMRVRITARILSGPS